MKTAPIHRNLTADLLKGIAVVLMIQVHLMELFASRDLYDGSIGKLSLFLGGIPAAPIFMVVMGYFIGRSKKGLMDSLMRGLKLILLGFALNIGLNLHLLIKIGYGIFDLDPLPYLFGVDILFLAGLGIMALSVLKNTLHGKPIVPALTILVLMGIQLLLNSQNIQGNYFTAFFYGEGMWWSYFPFIPWFVYPLLGMLYFTMENSIAVLIQKYRWYILILTGISVLLFFGYGLGVSSQLEEYYHHDYLFFFYALLFIVFWSLSFQTILEAFPNKFFGFLAWIGRNVTAAYVIQWLIIGNLATALYKTQTFLQLCLWFILICVLTTGGILLWERIKESREKRPLIH